MLDFLHVLADAAAGIIRKHFRRLDAHEVHLKTLQDPVTVADKEIERTLVALIHERFPDHAVLAEEFTDTGDRSGPLWVIDPLDGTLNYLHGLPITCCSIAYLEGGSRRAAMVDAPLLGERFAAVRAGGATLNGEPIRVSGQGDLAQAMLCTGFADLRKYGDPANLGVFRELMPQAAGIRRLGSAALDLCWVACGRFDGFWERQLSPWDTAAASLIVEEAGGTVWNLGREGCYDPMNGDILAASPGLARHLHAAYLRCFAGEGGALEADRSATVQQLKDEMAGFVKERDWNKFHTPKDLAASIAIEAAELMEVFQWLDPERVRERLSDEGRMEHVREELSDILAYVLSMANVLNVDVASAFRRKMARNRLKYPVEQVFGRWKE